MKLSIATSQFPVSSDLDANAREVLKQMRQAKDCDAHVVHFCEGALSGYAGVDFQSFEGFDWARLKANTLRVLELARELQLWVVVGSSHPLSGDHKPHNSVYVINSGGVIVDRYDKRFCASNGIGESGELALFTPGNHSTLFEIRGLSAGTLICHEYRYPELYRDLKRRGVELLFHSFHAGNVPAQRLQAMQREVGAENHKFNSGDTYPEITMPATMQAAAASSHLWISCSNSSAPHSCFGAFFVRADGVITGRLPRNTTDLLITTIDTEQPLYDSTRAWRERSMAGKFHSGSIVEDPRSKNRSEL